MTDTTETQAPTRGRITRWTVGNREHWCTFDVDLGIIQAQVDMTSREAREFAIAVLSDQGPFLGYQPPNESMRESRNVHPFDTGRRGEPSWRKREKIKHCQRRLDELLDEFGDEAFGWALQRLSESP